MFIIDKREEEAMSESVHFQVSVSSAQWECGGIALKGFQSKDMDFKFEILVSEATAIQQAQVVASAWY